jgi:hypothetical protein
MNQESRDFSRVRVQVPAFASFFWFNQADPDGFCHAECSFQKSSPLHLVLQRSIVLPLSQDLMLKHTEHWHILHDVPQ